MTTGEEIEQPADVVVLTSYVFNNSRLLLNSKIGQPYNPSTGKGVIGRNYAYQVVKGAASGYFEDQKFNNFAGAGALGMVIDDFNGDNFDHSDLDFIHGGYLSLTQTGKRPIANNPIPAGSPTWGKEFKQNFLDYINQSLSVGAMGASMPYKHHFLDLDPTYKDTFGDPLLRMTFDFEKQDQQLAKFTSKKASGILKEMGASKVDAMDELGPYNITT